jgi:hypothetical protein
MLHVEHVTLYTCPDQAKSHGKIARNPANFSAKTHFATETRLELTLSREHRPRPEERAFCARLERWPHNQLILRDTAKRPLLQR